MLDNAGIAIFLFVAIVIIGVIIYDSKQNLKFIFDKRSKARSTRHDLSYIEVYKNSYGL